MYYYIIIPCIVFLKIQWGFIAKTKVRVWWNIVYLAELCYSLTNKATILKHKTDAVKERKNNMRDQYVLDIGKFIVRHYIFIYFSGSTSISFCSLKLLCVCLCIIMDWIKSEMKLDIRGGHASNQLSQQCVP
jgi:hypothetical protein